MSGSVLEKVLCSSCGIEVRDGSVFCFNCGESVVAEPPPPPIIKPATGTLNDRWSNNDRVRPDQEPEPAAVAMPFNDPIVEKREEDRVNGNIAPATGSRTRLVRKKTGPVEFEWVEPSGASIGYLVGVLIVAIFGAVLLALALYLR